MMTDKSTESSSSSSSSSASYRTPIIEPLCIVWNESDVAISEPWPQEQQQQQSSLSDGWETTIDSIVHNKRLTEREKCFLCLTITERQLYKRDLRSETVRLVFETQEDPMQAGRFLCRVKKNDDEDDDDDDTKNLQRKKKKKKKKKKKTNKSKRLRKFLARLGIAIIGPTVGAIAGVLFRVCCLFGGGSDNG